MNLLKLNQNYFMILVVNKHKHTPTNNDYYIGRGSALGNPYTSQDLDKTKAEFQAKDREESVYMYREYLLNKIKNKDPLICNELNKIYKLSKRGDINLVCFCAPKSCHGSVIKEVIESKY